MGFIDSDSHVLECEETWDYFDPSEVEYRPTKVSRNVAGAEELTTKTGVTFSDMWLINREWCPMSPANGVLRDNGNRYDPLATTLADPSRRIADMDALGIDFQVLQTTTFLITQVQNPLAEAAIKRSWNRWMAERVADAGGRLGWVAQVPTLMMDRGIQEVEFAKAHGAVGVHLHAVEQGVYLDDPYLTPLLARIEDLELPIVAHIGRPNSQALGVLPIGRQFPTFAPFVEHMASPMTVFWMALVTDLHDRFPRLRICINEIGASFAVSLEHQHRRIVASAGDFRIPPFKPEIFEERNIFISCFADENLPMLTSLLGENVMMFGTDYSHNDASSQLTGHSSIARRNDLSEAVTRKITDANARRAFGVAEDFLPTDAVGAMGGDIPHTAAFDLAIANDRNIVGIGV